MRSTEVVGSSRFGDIAMRSLVYEGGELDQESGARVNTGKSGGLGRCRQRRVRQPGLASMTSPGISRLCGEDD